MNITSTFDHPSPEEAGEIDNPVLEPVGAAEFGPQFWP
jgi:hypothetical protein